ncbi:Ankyrin repeat [Durusdinium trenchii]|uniref:PH and SEC7 domain containing protein secG n=1 Tax=Durusdinium trenchii TaxID=1381693 RepID=A0ABP0J3P0_9DINO
MVAVVAAPSKLEPLPDAQARLAALPLVERGGSEGCRERNQRAKLEPMCTDSSKTVRTAAAPKVTEILEHGSERHSLQHKVREKGRPVSARSDRSNRSLILRQRPRSPMSAGSLPPLSSLTDSPTQSPSESKPNKSLLEAVKAGQLTTVRLLLNDKSFATHNAERKRCVHEAAAKGFVPICAELVKFGSVADLCSRDENGRTPMHKAAQGGHTGVVNFLCQQGSPTDVLDSVQMETPLHMAAAHGHSAVVLRLLEQGANPAILARGGFASWHVAAQHGHADIVAALGARVAAGTLQKENFAAVTESLRQTALHIAAEKGFASVCSELLQLGMPVDQVDRDRKTALHLAAVSGDVETVQLLLDAAAKLDIADINAATPLILAAEAGFTEVCALLLEHGSNINAVTCHHSSALHKAAMNGHLETTTALISAGACVAIKDNRKSTPLIKAASQGFAAICTALLDAAPNHINQHDFCSATALFWAAGGGHTETCSMLLQRGARVNDCDFKGQTPFMWAARHNHIETCRVLVAHGATDPIGQNAIFAGQCSGDGQQQKGALATQEEGSEHDEEEDPSTNVDCDTPLTTPRQEGSPVPTSKATFRERMRTRLFGGTTR